MSNRSGVTIMEGLTRIERKVFDILSDGRPHTVAELMTCLEPFSSVSALHFHIKNVRRKLRSSSYGINCDESTHSTTTYRLVQNLVSPYDGKQ